jgi:hypothetical protein
VRLATADIGEEFEQRQLVDEQLADEIGRVLDHRRNQIAMNERLERHGARGAGESNVRRRAAVAAEFLRDKDRVAAAVRAAAAVEPELFAQRAAANAANEWNTSAVPLRAHGKH